jgi:hypothetical protein
MGAYMANAFADMSKSFLGSYKDQLAENERRRRQEEEDAWTRENRDRQRKSWQQDDAADAAIGAAMAPAQRDGGYRVTDAAGSDAFTKDADAAAMMQDMAGSANGGALQRRSFRVQDQTYDTEADANAAEAKYNSPSQQMSRSADAVSAIDPKRSQQLRADSMQTRAAEMTLSKAEEAEVNERFNMSLLEEVDGAPTWYEGAAKFGTKMLQGRGVVEPRPSPDGKSVSLVVVTPDGKEQVTGVYEDSPKGFEEFVQKSAKLDTKSKLGILSARAQMLRDEEAAAAERQNRIDDRQAGFENQVKLAELQHRQAMARQRAAQSGVRDKEGPATTAVDPKTGNPVSGRIVNGKFVPYDMGGYGMPTRSVDPQKYTAVLKDNVEIYGGDLARARIATDEQFGMRSAPAQQGAASPDAALLKMQDERSRSGSGQLPQARQPAAKPLSVEGAMNPGGNDSVSRVMAPKIQQMQQIAQQYQLAKQMTAAAAKSGDPAAVQHYAQQQQSLATAIKGQLSGMNPQQAQQVMSALGL